MTYKLRTKDIDELLRLFRQLEKLLKSDLPKKNEESWQQSMDQAKRDFVQKLKEQESRLSSRAGRMVSETKQGESQEKCGKIVNLKAEEIYCEKDPTYAKAVDEVKKSIEEVIKKIDHTLYAIQDSLLEFDRAHGTLLETDWRKIRDILIVIDVAHPDFQFGIQNAIDALEAIKRKVKQHQRKFKRITSLLWKAYEVTLKVIVDAVLEKSCPK